MWTRTWTGAFIEAALWFLLAVVLLANVPAWAFNLVDQWLGAHDVVWAAAGHPHTVFPTSFAELVRITGGTPADVGAGAVDAVPPAH